VLSTQRTELEGESGRRAAHQCAARARYRDELSELLFHGERLGAGYLPADVESPTDPLFFGITPGDPQFVRETPAPTETPAP
jgi:hypothetical protein